MMVALRAVSRAVALALFLGAWLLLHLAGRLFTWTAASRCRWRRFYLQRGARTSLAILHGEVTVEGELPADSSVIVCNHLGYVDILVLASVATVVFVSRADVEGWVGVGPLAASAGTIFLDRGRRRDIPRALESMRSALTRNGSVVFFPEGTSSDGTSVLPFRSSLFEAAARVQVPIVCVALAYRTPPGEESPETAVAWWEEELGFFAHFWRLVRLSSFRATVRVLRPPLQVCEYEGRQELSRVAQSRIEGALAELRGESEW
jgi:1-acyl-sn-glycerol-3-phosphate acyltransferase